MDIATLWKDRGIHLRDAPRRLVPARLASPLPSNRPNCDSELTGGWKSLAEAKGWDQNERYSIKKGIDAIEAMTNSVLATGRINYERARYVADLVVAQKALAIGFPTGATEPRIIPSYMFENDAFIKWGKNEVVGNGLQFISVKVIKLRRSEFSTNYAEKIRQKAQTKVGRPSSDELVGIIRELNGNPEFSKRPGKTQVTVIRKMAMDKYPGKFKNGRGLSTPTIYRFMRMVSAS